ncbi:hypothetical protein [Micromonospora sp. NPDC049240]|uniref:hypothetical protein n=1 Tax=Micromonospora sp. NPDC049240 TaxID=3155151 RepID=UPI00340F04F4
MLITVWVLTASWQDRDGAKGALLATYAATPIRHVFAGRLVDWARDLLRTTVEIVRKPANQKGFVVHSRRWAVERTLAWSPPTINAAVVHGGLATVLITDGATEHLSRKDNHMIPADTEVGVPKPDAPPTTRPIRWPGRPLPRRAPPRRRILTTRRMNARSCRCRRAGGEQNSPRTLPWCRSTWLP